MVKSKFKLSFLRIDWLLTASFIPLLGAGLITMRPMMESEGAYFFNRQVIWIAVSFLIFFFFSQVDWSFLKNSGLLLLLFGIAVCVLLVLFLIGETIRGASSWFDLVFFSVEPADPIKLLIILVLAKYFTRRHIEIARFRHILISGFYIVLPSLLVFLQPDFGSASVFVLIWLGMILVSGISKKHLLLVILMAMIIFATSWMFVLKPYQKERVMVFMNPLQDPRGAGYNALQSMIAIGSGQVWGKGLGYGTQSRLAFLPEYRTDFIFAAFAEEWGLTGVLIVFFCFGFLIWRILKNAQNGQTNFERLFGIGIAIFIMTHFVLHTGMNMGILPITGLNMPFMSYGGSNMVTIFAGLGILMGMRRYSQNA
ncbi:rod shape-determining protein RodA [Patescibacteria group bacterium]|nr:rod shape-determining protein RodA [Patescibacteria group bacterium]